MMNNYQPLNLSLFVVLSTFCMAGCSESANSPSGKASTQGPPTEAESPPETVSAPAKSVIDAAFGGDVDVIRQHIAAGTDLNLREPIGGGTALIAAASTGQNDSVILLIEGGADLEVKNNDGSTALLTAAFLCHEEVLRTLLKRGADRNARNNAGATALDSVESPFGDVKPIYDFLQQVLGPAGLELDYEFIETTRPKIADILRGQ